MAVRPKHVWDANRLAEMMFVIDAVLHEFETQCYEAADRAPETWRPYWMAEGAHCNRVRRSMLHRVQSWLDYAKGHCPEVLCERTAKGEADD